jgi:hypothetical protein
MNARTIGDKTTSPLPAVSQRDTSNAEWSTPAAKARSPAVRSMSCARSAPKERIAPLVSRTYLFDSTGRMWASYVWTLTRMFTADEFTVL